MMTDPLRSKAAQPHPPDNTRAGVLYASGHFQVRLWELPSGESIERFPESPIDESQSFLIAGDLEIRSGSESKHPTIGQHFVVSGQTISLHNPGKQTARLLEVCWGSEFEPVPLQEVTETRPWGSFTVLKDEPDYKLKQLQVKPGNRLSLQRHAQREEHWLITSGKPEVTLDEQKHLLNARDYIHIPLRSWHRIANPGADGAVEIIELQLGQYFGEDDIERREDDYGRA